MEGDAQASGTVSQEVIHLKRCSYNESTHVFDSRTRLPRLVTVDWIEQSWKEDTLLDEERMYGLIGSVLFLIRPGFTPR